MFEGSDWETPPDSSFYVAALPPTSYLQWRVREQKLRKLRAYFSAPSCTGMSGAQLLWRDMILMQVDPSALKETRGPAPSASA